MTIVKGGLGGQPAGYGRPNNDFNSTSNSGMRSSYLSRLMGTVSANQRAANGHNQTDSAAGFQSYSYNKGKGSGVFNGMFAVEEGVMSDEEYRLDVIEQAAYKGTELYSMLHNRHGRFYSAVKAALDFFPKPDRVSARDPVLGEFADEVLNNLNLYRYCCSYTCILFSAVLADYALAGRTEELIKNERLQYDAVFNNFVNVIGMQFLSWLENHPDAVILQNRLLPTTRERIERFENGIDNIHGMILSVSIGNNQVPFPWKKGALRRIMEKTHIPSSVYEVSNMYKDSATIESNSWNLGDDSSFTNENGLPSWLKNHITSQENINYGNSRPSTQAFDFDKPSTDVNGWDNDKIVKIRNNKELINLAKKVTKDNRHEFNLNHWFKRIPTMDCYIIDPNYFMYIADALENIGETPDYGRNGWLSVGCVPVVKLNWENGAYSYDNIYVGDENMELVLTNPEEVIPKLHVDNKEAILASFDQYVSEMNDVVKTTELSEAHIECKDISTPPKVVYGSSPISIDTNEDLIKTVKEVSYLVNERMDHDPDILVLPMVSRKAIPIDDIKFNYTLIEKKLPYLITGYESSMTSEVYFNTIRKQLESIGSQELTQIVSSHLTNVVNRWLVECRYYSDNKEDRNYLAIHNIFDDYNDFMSKAKQYDPPTAKALYLLFDDEFLCENITLFANKSTQEKYIEKIIKNMDEGITKDARKATLEKSVLLERRYAFAKITPMAPLNYVGRVVIEGSYMPEIKWIIDKVPDYLLKHFNRRVPIVIGFSKDDSPKVWTITRSNFCNSKFSLRRLSLNSPLPLFKQMQ